MNCQESRKLVHLFVDGALDPRANVDVLAHINMCAACGARFADAKKFEDFLKEKLRPEPAPEALRARIGASLSEMSSPWPLRVVSALRRRPLLPMTGVAALILLSVVGWRGLETWRTCPFVKAVTAAG